MTAGAGESWDEFVERTVAEGLGGIECLSGIPGTVGGTPIQNVGAYGQEVSRTIDTLTAFDTVHSSVATLRADDCGFGYRRSRFKLEDAGRFVVCTVTFRLRPQPPVVAYPDLLGHLSAEGISTPTLRQAREAVLAVRRRKGMVLDEDDVDTRSVGSFFTNPVVNDEVLATIAARVHQRPPSYPARPGRSKIPAAWLLERAGCTRGVGDGPVGLSSKHPLAIINRGGATAAEVVSFAAGVKRRVEDAFGISLVPGPVFFGFGDNEHVGYLRRGDMNVYASD
jgi:UDP-N-acetylmuramate dehydrogenase